MKSFFVFLLAFLLMCTLVRASKDLDIDELLEEEDDDDEKESEPIAKRQLTAMRDTIKNVVGSSVKYLTNARLVKGVSSFVQKAPAATGSAVQTLLQAVRSQWLKQSTTAQKALIKQLQGLTKRLSNSRLMIGNIGAKLTNREESATKNTKADEISPTSLPKQEETDDRVKMSETKFDQENDQFYSHQHLHQPSNDQPSYPYPALTALAHLMQPDHMNDLAYQTRQEYFVPPPVQPFNQMIVDPMYGGW